jgi:WD40 repeat protein
MIRNLRKLNVHFAVLLFIGLSITLFTQISANPYDTTFEIFGLAWNPAGTRLAVATDEGLKVFDQTLQLIEEIGDFNDVVSAVAWSPDGTQLATGAWYSDGRTQIWNYNTVSDVATLERTLVKEALEYYGVAALEWSPNGSKLAELGEHAYMTITGKLTIFETANWTRTETKNIQDQLNKVVWNPDSNKVAVAGKPSNAFVYIVDALTMESEQISESILPFRVLEWTSTSQLILGTQLNITVIDALDSVTVNTLNVTPPTYSVGSWNENHKALGYVSANSVKILHVPTNTEVFNYVIESIPVALDWSNTDKIALAGSYTLEIIDVSSITDPSGTSTLTPNPTYTPIHTPTLSVPTSTLTPQAVEKVAFRREVILVRSTLLI